MLSSFSSSSVRFASKLKIRPLGSRVIIKIDDGNKEKVGNIYVPEAAQKSTNQGTILAVGPGAFSDGKRLPMSLKVGQKVLLPQFGGQVVKIDNQEYTVIMEEDVLGILD